MANYSKILSTHEYQDTKNRWQKSNVVLIVNNWKFVKDLDAAAPAPLCQLKNWSIELKISSTTFRSPTSQREPYLSEDGRELWFDRNGVCMSYDGFMGLLNHPEFIQYMAHVKNLYEMHTAEDTSPTEEEENRSGSIANAKKQLKFAEETQSTTEDEADGQGEEEEEEEEDDPQFQPLTQKASSAKSSSKTPPTNKRTAAAAALAAANKNLKKTKVRRKPKSPSPDAVAQDIANSNNDHLFPDDLIFNE